jgi:hypothetical protein
MYIRCVDRVGISGYRVAWAKAETGKVESRNQPLPDQLEFPLGDPLRLKQRWRLPRRRYTRPASDVAQVWFERMRQAVERKTA